MFTFTRQVQNACDFAAKTTARLAAVDVPDYANTETSFAQLKERIATVLKYVQGFKAEQFNGAETRVIELPMGGTTMELTGEQFFVGFGLPNFSSTPPPRTTSCATTASRSASAISRTEVKKATRTILEPHE